jgi:hypothetical protein
MNTTSHPSNVPALDASAASPAYQAFRLLHLGFVAAPILAGLDKFFHLLVNWDQYVPSVVARISPIGVHQLMMIVPASLRSSPASVSRLSRVSLPM